MGGYCGDGEPVTLFKQRIIRARKKWKCDDCDGTIKRGDQFVWESFKLEGDFYVHRTCLSCEEVFTFLWADGAECLHHGSLLEYVRELAPHDFLPGGSLEKYPRGCKPVDAWVDKHLDLLVNGGKP